MKEFYAIKFKDGSYLASTSGSAPALYTSPGKAEATLRVRKKYYEKHLGDEYTIVKFSEIK